VFVTHDQEEALTVADRIGVMNHGCIEQIADPQTLYRRPGSEYVATFIGLTNRLPGITNGEEAVVFGQRVPLLEASKRDASTVLVRPENLVITLAANDGNMVGEHGRVDMVHFLGALARVDLTVAAGVGHLPVTVQLPANELPAGLTVGSEVVVAPRPIAALAV
jgi:putative spermidine/putrescine transport system ATP-binding protein